MLDRTSELGLPGFADCPTCDVAMAFKGASLVSKAHDVIEEFECVACGVTRMRPRPTSEAGSFDLFAMLGVASPRATAPAPTGGDGTQ